MSFYKFAQYWDDCYVAENGFMLSKITGGINLIPCKTSTEGECIIVHILMMEGEMTVCYGKEHYKLGKYCITTLIDNNQLQIISAKPDTRAYIMLLTKTYADDLLKFNPPMPISFLTKSRTQPVSMLSKESFDKLVYRMEIIREACKNTMHLFRNRMIRSALMMFLLDVSDIHIREYGSDKLFEISRRGIALFHSFMEMLPIHAAVEHNVVFYANQLCVTPQYLNRIVKSASGRTISEWINFQLIGMITKRIEETEDSMLQIANEYNFTDQAALTKFYKRETGYTPSSYRIKCSDK